MPSISEAEAAGIDSNVIVKNKSGDSALIIIVAGLMALTSEENSRIANLFFIHF